jgi:hypothetical protein
MINIPLSNGSTLSIELELLRAVVVIRQTPRNEPQLQGIPLPQVQTITIPLTDLKKLVQTVSHVSSVFR